MPQCQSIAILFFILTTLGAQAPFFANDTTSTFTISGECRVKGQGSLHIFLLTRDQFKAEADSAALHLVLEIELQSPATSFRFAAVSPGEYGIRCYLDKNGNGKLDMGTFGPKEPWGMSKNKRPFMRSPRFDEICFSVADDVAGLVIQVK